MTAVGWRVIEPITSSCDQATAVIAYEACRADDDDGAIEIARHLRLRGRLTAAFMLRMLLMGDRSLLIAALADLSGLPLQRVSGFVRSHDSGGFAAVYARARMPADMLCVFRSALAAQDHHDGF